MNVWHTTLERLSAGERAPSMVTRQASEAAARAYAQDAIPGAPEPDGSASRGSEGAADDPADDAAAPEPEAKQRIMVMRLRQDAWKQVNIAALARGTTAHGLMIEALNDWFTKHGKPPSMSDLYGDDILLWAEGQAALLRRMAAGDPVNEAPDWLNIIEEVEGAGSKQLHAVEGLMIQALVNMLKAESWPLALGRPKWLVNARQFRADAGARFTPSMRQRIDIASLYAAALARLPDTMNGQAPRAAPNTCPITLDELLAEDS
jgi:Domain of unknown function DUF29